MFPRSIKEYVSAHCKQLGASHKKRDTKAPIPDRKLSEGDSTLLKDHTTSVWDPRYTRDYWIISFPRRTQVKLVDLKGKVKILHISDIIYVLPADRVISKLPDYQQLTLSVPRGTHG